MIANERLFHGLDTSVVVRLLWGEPVDQALVAKAFVENAAAKGLRLVVSDLVIAESYFSLQHHYGVSKDDALKGILKLLESRLVEPQFDSPVLPVLKNVISGSKKLDFVDRVIYEQYRLASAPMVTFERAAGRLPGVTVLRG